MSARKRRAAAALNTRICSRAARTSPPARTSSTIHTVIIVTSFVDANRHTTFPSGVSSNAVVRVPSCEPFRYEPTTRLPFGRSCTPQRLPSLRSGWSAHAKRRTTRPAGENSEMAERCETTVLPFAFR